MIFRRVSYTTQWLDAQQDKPEIWIIRRCDAAAGARGSRRR